MKYFSVCVVLCGGTLVLTPQALGEKQGDNGIIQQQEGSSLTEGNALAEEKFISTWLRDIESSSLKPIPEDLFSRLEKKIKSDFQQKKWNLVNDDLYLLHCLMLKSQIEAIKNSPDTKQHVLDGCVRYETDIIVPLFIENRPPANLIRFNREKLIAFLKKNGAGYLTPQEEQVLEATICYFDVIQAFCRYQQNMQKVPSKISDLEPQYLIAKGIPKMVSIQNGVVCFGQYQYSNKSFYNTEPQASTTEVELKNKNETELISALSHFPSLKKVVICNSTVDFDKIKLPASITELFLLNCKVKNIGELKYLKGLHYLSLSGSTLERPEELSALSELEYLILNKTNIVTLAPLSSLKKLTRLEFSHTKVSTLTPLTSLSELTFLLFESVPVKTLDGLESLSKLEYILFPKSEVSDIHAILQLKHLKNVNMLFTQVPKDQVLLLKKNPNICIAYIEN